MTHPGTTRILQTEILEVTSIPCDGQLTGRGVESPSVDEIQQGHVVSIAGWVHASPAAPVRVHIVSEGHVVSTAAVSFARPDVAGHLRLADDEPLGFRTELSVLGLPIEFELRLEAELADGRQFAFASIRGIRQPLAARRDPALSPIFVTNIGRCGSTLMMNLLRLHPRIAVHDLYPYETRALNYWAHMLRVLSGPADHERSANPNSYEHELFWVGRHPHNMWPVVEPEPMRRFLRHSYLDHLTELCCASTEAFYEAVCESQSVEGAIYFAEKRNPRPTARIASELYPGAREIFLVRDPRDMVCSMIGFHDKTGLVSFGRDNTADDEAFVRSIAHALMDLARHQRERGDRAIVVRYEDLVEDMRGAFARILDYLELPTEAVVLEAILEEAQRNTADSRRHRTTADGDSSIGRWRHDLSEPLQELCERELGSMIAEFGYES